MKAVANTFHLSPEIVETATRDRAIMKYEGKPQSVPEGQDKRKAVDLSRNASQVFETGHSPLPPSTFLHHTSFVPPTF